MRSADATYICTYGEWRRLHGDGAFAYTYEDLEGPAAKEALASLARWMEVGGE